MVNDCINRRGALVGAECPRSFVYINSVFRGRTVENHALNDLDARAIFTSAGNPVKGQLNGLSKLDGKSITCQNSELAGSSN